MTLHTVILDAQPSYLLPAVQPASLLLLPAGRESLLALLLHRIERIAENPPTILTTFPATEAYRIAVGQSAGKEIPVTSVEEYGRLVLTWEPSDSLLLIDPRCLPASADAFRRFVEEHGSTRGACHLVALDSSLESTREFVQLDTDQRIRRIERRYEGVTWNQVADVAASLVPGATLQAPDCRRFESLLELRRQLASGGVPSHDTALFGDFVDLRKEQVLLEFVEMRVQDLLSSGGSERGSLLAGGVEIGTRCNVHPSARIYGPVMLQDGVSLEAEAVIIGPAIIGSGAVVKRGALVAQSLVLPDTVLPESVTLRHCVFGGTAKAQAASNGPFVRPGPLRCRPRRPVNAGTSPVQGFSPSASLPGRSTLYPRIKRLADVTLSAAGVVLLSPLMMALALIIKAGSRGPVFYRDEREGRGGRTFRCLKFRTMVRDAHLLQDDLQEANQVDGPQFKISKDPRVTRIGTWLRKTNADELPQLLNVLLGQMSLIGPRPSPFRENQICVPWRQARLSVRPGITGLWQLCRHDRAIGDFHQWILYDMLYVRHQSLGLDLKILAATLLTLGGRWCIPVSWLIPKREFIKHEQTQGLLAWGAIAGERGTRRPAVQSTGVTKCEI